MIAGARGQSIFDFVLQGLLLGLCALCVSASSDEDTFWVTLPALTQSTLKFSHSAKCVLESCCC